MDSSRPLTPNADYSRSLRRDSVDLDDLDHQRPPKKRRRPALSCVQCRNRKVKCDRTLPSCLRCAKSGHAEQCVYEDNTVIHTQSDRRLSTPGPASRFDQASREWGMGLGMSEPRSGAPGPGDLWGSSHRQKLEMKVENLQRLVEDLAQSRRDEDDRNLLNNGPFGSDPGMGFIDKLDHRLNAPEQPARVTSDMTLLRGKNTKTRFYGRSHEKSLLTQFPELGAFVTDMKNKNQVLSRLRIDMGNLKKNRYKYGQLHRDPKEQTSIDKSQLLELLPNRGLADELIDIYLQQFETTHRIFHIPTFRKQYLAFWEAPAEAETGFLVQILLALACASSFHSSNSSTSGFVGESSPGRTRASEWVMAAEVYLKHAPMKRIDIPVLRTQCLMIRAQVANAIDLNIVWTKTGTLIRQAMAAGYHREPSKLARISAFDREMRRRIWTTIVELDLDASMTCGMPPASASDSDFDCLPPVNINDEDFDETSEERPISQPLEAATDCTFQTLLLHSLPLRLKICATVNSTRIQMFYPELLRIDEQLVKELSFLPRQLTGARQEQYLYWKSILDLTLQKCLLTLHMPFALHAQRDPRFIHSRRSCVETASVMLCRHRQLLDNGTLIPCVTRHDAFQAALVICRELYHEDSGYISGSVRDIVPDFTRAYISTAEIALAVLEARLITLGRGSKEYYFFCMVIALVKTHLWPELAEDFRQHAVDLIAKMGFRFCALQTYYPSPETSADGEDAVNAIGAPAQGPTESSANLDEFTSAQQNTSIHTTPEGFDFMPEDFDVGMFGLWNMEEILNF